MKSGGPESAWHSCKSRPHLTLAVVPVFTDSWEREDLSRATSDFSALMPFAVGGHLKKINKTINPVTPFGPAAKRNTCTEGGRWGRHPPDRSSNPKRVAPNPSVDNDELCSLGRTQPRTEFHTSAYAPKAYGSNPARSHREPNTRLSERDVRRWITRRCSSTFNLIFLPNCGWYNGQQSLQGQGNKVIDARGQGSRPTWTFPKLVRLRADALITERTQSSAVMWVYNRHSPRTTLACLRRQGSFCFSSPLMQCVWPRFLVLLHHSAHGIFGF